MLIDIRNIPPEGMRIHQKEPAGILSPREKDVKFDTAIDVDVQAYLTGGTLMVLGRLRTKAGLVCSRCLLEFEKELVNKDFSFELDVKRETRVTVTSFIREGIIVLLPVKPLCKSTCRGLCQRCGQDLNKKDCGCGTISNDK